MNILLTGLCLQGNKGGPALALSLMTQLRRLRPDLTFTLAVPGDAEYRHEERWAARYGVAITANLRAGDLLPPFAFAPARWRRSSAWRQQAARSAVVLDMSGIAYVGPPEGSNAAALQGRFVTWLGSRLVQRPLRAWTQSYGPFSTPLVRLLARLDLGGLPEIYCRGDDCLHAVQELLPGKPALSFPDVALTLPYDRSWGERHVAERFGLAPGGYVTLSPSAVIHQRTHDAAGNGHVRRLAALCRWLQAQGQRVLLVPHTFRPGRHDPDHCDYGVALAVRQELAGLPGVDVLADDLAADELKAVIAGARVHVGARYHSLVAALSAGVPALSLSWHPKYRDLMRQYGVADFVHDAVAVTDDAVLPALLARLLAESTTIHRQLVAVQPQLEAAVADNARRLLATLPEAS